MGRVIYMLEKSTNIFIAPKRHENVPENVRKRNLTDGEGGE